MYSAVRLAELGPITIHNLKVGYKCITASLHPRVAAIFVYQSAHQAEAEDPAAYHLFLQGRYELYKTTPRACQSETVFLEG